VETGAQRFSFRNGLAELHLRELLDPVVERLLIDMAYSSLPGLRSGEDYEWSKTNHELNELVSQARWHMLGNLERINQVCRFSNLRCRGLRDVETTAIHTLPPGQADSVSRVFQPQCAHSFSNKLGRKCSAPTSDIDGGLHLWEYLADGGHHLRRILKRI
jgi:hypothetical protein